jgi:hypothetical protein
VSPLGRRDERPGQVSPEEARRQQVDRVRDLTQAFLHDLLAWLRDAYAPLEAVQFPEYRLERVRDLPDPRERMRRYVNQDLLAMWGPALDGWLAQRLRLRASLGDATRVRVDGLEETQPAARVRLVNRSVIEQGNRRQESDGVWMLQLDFSPDLKRIENAELRPASRRPDGP